MSTLKTPENINKPGLPKDFGDSKIITHPEDDNEEPSFETVIRDRRDRTSSIKKDSTLHPMVG